MVKTKSKKGGNLKLEQQLESNTNNNNPLKNSPLENQDNHDDDLSLQLENSFSNKSKQGGEDLTNTNNQNNELLNVNNDENNKDNSLVDSASTVMKSGLNIVNNALTGFTGNKVKIGGATPLQSKLYTVLHNRAVNLKGQLETLHAEQQNIQKRTGTILNDTNGLLKQFTQYKKMGGGKKTYKKGRDRKHHHKKSRGRKHHHKKSRGRKRRH